MDRSRSTTTPARSMSSSTSWVGSRQGPRSTRCCRHACSTPAPDHRSLALLSETSRSPALPVVHPAGAAAVALNVTVTNPAAASFLTVWPSGSGRPLASNLNFSAGQTVANTVIVKLGTNGKISLFTPANADVVIDVLGWFPATGSFSGLVPARLMDTRRDSSSPLTPGTSWQWQIDGSTIDETVLDGVSNPKKMFDIDMFTTDAGTIQRLHAKGIYVVCYVETGELGELPPRCLVVSAERARQHA